MTTATTHHVYSVSPNWSADELAAAVPQTMPALHTFAFQPPANDAQLHHPRRVAPAYVANAALTPFRVHG